MARLLFITNGLRGGLNANYELARRLTAAGHTVGFLGYNDLAEQIGRQGYSYTRVCADAVAMSDLRDRLDRVGRVRSLALGVSLRRRVIRSREIESAVRAEAPDALIIDLEAHYSILATRSLGIPTVLKNDFFSLRYQRGTPPLHSEQAYPVGWRARRRADLSWAQAQAERLALNTVGELHPRQLMRRVAPFRYNTVSRRDLRAVARARDLQLRALTTQGAWLRPHTYAGLPIVTATARELDFVTETTPNDQWIGPLVFRDRTDVALTAADRGRWEHFRDQNRAAGRPLLYCAFGTMLPDTSQMLAQVLRAAKSRPEYDLVVGIGGRGEPVAAADEPNVLVLDYAPQLEVLAHADAALIHGGINTINECLIYGVPMIVEQTGPTDGPGNASRVEHHGLGVRVRFATVDPTELAATIDVMLTDAALRRRVATMQRHAVRYERDHVAETAIDQLLAGDLDRSVG